MWFIFCQWSLIWHMFWLHAINLAQIILSLGVFTTHQPLWNNNNYMVLNLVKTIKSMLYTFFWVIPWRLKFICRHFRTLCLSHLHRQVGACRMNSAEGMLGYYRGKRLGLEMAWVIKVGGDWWIACFAQYKPCHIHMGRCKLPVFLIPMHPWLVESRWVLS